MIQIKFSASVILAAALLGGCAASSQQDAAWGGDVCNARAQATASGAGTALREKQVIRTLTEIKADAAQRQAVLAAFDLLAPVLSAAADTSSERQARRRQLDPHAPDYLRAADALAQQQAAALAEREHQLALFNRSVASTLSASQWAEWQAVLLSEQAEVEDLQRRGYGGGGRRAKGGD